MSFSLWYQGSRIGETALDLGPRHGRTRIGVLHPTEEGERLIACAKPSGGFELRDAQGVVLAHDALAVNDLHQLTLLLRGDAASSAMPRIHRGGQSVRYLISVTLARDSQPVRRQTAAFRLRKRED